MKLDAALLAGGRSSRMGADKSDLTLDGRRFLDIISAELADFDHRLLSLGQGGGRSLAGFTALEDIHPDKGAIGGLHAVLRACRGDALLVVACDMPLYRRELGAYLIEHLRPEDDAVVPVTRDGRLHPLCAVYHLRVAEVLETQITSGRHRLLEALEQTALRRVTLSGTPFPDSMLANINTPAEYEAMKRMIEGMGETREDKS